MNVRQEAAGREWLRGVWKRRAVEEGSKVREAGVLRELRFCEMVSSMVDRETCRNARNKRGALAQSRKRGKVGTEVSERCAFQCACRETELWAQWWVVGPRWGGHFGFDKCRNRRVQGTRAHRRSDAFATILYYDGESRVISGGGERVGLDDLMHDGAKTCPITASSSDFETLSNQQHA